MGGEFGIPSLVWVNCLLESSLARRGLQASKRVNCTIREEIMEASQVTSQIRRGGKRALVPVVISNIESLNIFSMRPTFGYGLRWRDELKS
jgi:hypothetical protein